MAEFLLAESQSQDTRRSVPCVATLRGNFFQEWNLIVKNCFLAPVWQACFTAFRAESIERTASQKTSVLLTAALFMGAIPAVAQSNCSDLTPQQKQVINYRFNDMQQRCTNPFVFAPLDANTVSCLLNNSLGNQRRIEFRVTRDPNTCELVWLQRDQSNPQWREVARQN